MTTLRIINCTPHPVDIETANGVRRILPHHESARMLERQRRDDDLPGGIKVWSIVQGPVQHLPPPQPYTMYIVSRVVAMCYPERTDLLWPARAIWKDGRRVGTTGLMRWRGECDHD